MPILHVRNVPDRLYDDLRRRAAAAGRSLSAEVIALLDATVNRRIGIDPEVLERLRHHRAALEQKYGRFPSSVNDIRADRER